MSERINKIIRRVALGALALGGSQAAEMRFNNAYAQAGVSSLFPTESVSARDVVGGGNETLVARLNVDPFAPINQKSGKRELTTELAHENFRRLAESEGMSGDAVAAYDKAYANILSTPATMETIVKGGKIFIDTDRADVKVLVEEATVTEGMRVGAMTSGDPNGTKGKGADTVKFVTGTPNLQIEKGQERAVGSKYLHFQRVQVDAAGNIIRKLDGVGVLVVCGNGTADLERADYAAPAPIAATFKKIESAKIPCANLELVDDKRNISPNAQFKLTVVMDRAKAEAAGIEVLSQCGELVKPRACEEEACDLMDLRAKQIASARGIRNPNPATLASIKEGLVTLVYKPQRMANGKLNFSVPAEFVDGGYICRIPEADSRGRLVTFGRIGFDRTDIDGAMANGVGRMPASIIKPSSEQPLRDISGLAVDKDGYLTRTAPPAAVGYSTSYRTNGAQSVPPHLRVGLPSGNYDSRQMRGGQQERRQSNIGGRIVNGAVDGLAAGAYLGARDWAYEALTGNNSRRAQSRPSTRGPQVPGGVGPRVPMQDPRLGGMPQGGGTVIIQEQRVTSMSGRGSGSMDSRSMGGLYRDDERRDYSGRSWTNAPVYVPTNRDGRGF